MDILGDANSINHNYNNIRNKKLNNIKLIHGSINYNSNNVNIKT